MRPIKVAGATLNQTPLDWDGNKANILLAIDVAREAGVGLLCLPELCIPGYGCEDVFHAAGLRRMARRVLREILPETRGMVVSLGLPVFVRSALFNCAALVADGTILGFVAKRNLAGEGIYYEPRWFKPWPVGHRGEVDLDGEAFPIGDLSFEVGGVTIGFEICEDAWVAGRPGAGLSQHGADIILNPSASHFAFGKLEVRKRFVIEGSRAFGLTYVYSNLLGNEAGRAIYDGGVLIASGGELVAQGPRFGYEGAGITAATIDIDATRSARGRAASFTPALEPDPNCVRSAFRIPPAHHEPRGLEVERWESSPTIKEEEFTRAVSLALFDYMRKSRSRGFVVSLSGGADSSAVVTLVGQMVRLASGALGIEGFRRRLACAKLTGADAGALTGELLSTLYQATPNNSAASRDAARAVAAAVGARHQEFDVQGIVEAYTALAQSAEGRPLTWEHDDLCLQNIQARTRGPLAWFLANLRGALLLVTSDRSEAAVGYTTMDGDTCGGLSPIAGVDKAFLRRWLRWMETTGPIGLAPVPALALVNKFDPTPELRPQSAKQSAERDLMPYDVLDAIEDAAIGDKMTPSEVLEVLAPRFPSHARETLVGWVERFFTLWCRNQWKRERYAPAFHLDDKNLDPKTWCRFPILSGGYARELGELRRGPRTT